MRAWPRGPLGAGQVAQACNQLICAAEIVALSEASVVAERAGLDLAQLLDLLRCGCAGSVIMEDKAPKLVAHDYGVPAAGRAVHGLIPSGAPGRSRARRLAGPRAYGVAGLRNSGPRAPQARRDPRGSIRTGSVLCDPFRADVESCAS
ncbi:MAG: NAD-binding protein [Kocuria rhizophila]|nr:NAD-binding protein [Kocuria rhizophila]